MAPQQPHKTIYLQNWEDQTLETVTWCEDRVNDDDVEYILKSEFDRLNQELTESGKFICQQRNEIERLVKRFDDIGNRLLKVVEKWQKAK